MMVDQEARKDSLRDVQVAMLCTVGRLIDGNYARQLGLIAQTLTGGDADALRVAAQELEGVQTLLRSVEESVGIVLDRLYLTEALPPEVHTQ